MCAGWGHSPRRLGHLVPNHLRHPAGFYNEEVLTAVDRSASAPSALLAIALGNLTLKLGYTTASNDTITKLVVSLSNGEFLVSKLGAVSNTMDLVG